MQEYLEKAIVLLGELVGRVLTLSKVELAFFLGVVIGGALWGLASYIAYLREERKRKRLFLYEENLYGSHRTDGPSGQGGETEEDPIRRWLASLDSPEEGPPVDDRTENVGEARRLSHGKDRRGSRSVS